MSAWTMTGLGAVGVLGLVLVYRATPWHRRRRHQYAADRVLAVINANRQRAAVRDRADTQRRLSMLLRAACVADPHYLISPVVGPADDPDSPGGGVPPTPATGSTPAVPAPRVDAVDMRGGGSALASPRTRMLGHDPASTPPPPAICPAAQRM